jgi:hypothetical protein
LWHLLSSQSKTGKTWKRKGREVGLAEGELSRTKGMDGYGVKRTGFRCHFWMIKVIGQQKQMVKQLKDQNLFRYQKQNFPLGCVELVLKGKRDESLTG